MRNVFKILLGIGFLWTSASAIDIICKSKEECYEKGKALLFKEDPKTEQFLPYFRNACILGDKTSCEIVEKEDKFEKERLSRKVEIKCETGEECYEKGEKLLTGDGLEEDYMAFFKKSCGLKYESGCSLYEGIKERKKDFKPYKLPAM